MPLTPGNTRAAISQNIRELTTNGSRPRPRKQIIAIALNNARRTAGTAAPRKPRVMDVLRRKSPLRIR